MAKIPFPEGASSDGYMLRRSNNLYSNFFPHPMLCEMCGKEPIVRVIVKEDKKGTYWAWWDSQDKRFMFVNSNILGVNMCFPYGPEVEEERGRGLVCQVAIEVVPE